LPVPKGALASTQTQTEKQNGKSAIIIRLVVMEKSNKVLDIIARLRMLYESYGNVEVTASTQDGAEYDVYDEDINVEEYTNKQGETVNYIFIQ
jgi:hypothetical protein